MVRKGRAPHVSLEAQLQQLTLLSDIDSNPESFEQLGPIIKSLDEAHQQDEFLLQLREFVHKKDEEIEQVCNENHQEFVSSVDELLIVRSGAVNLKHRINELNQEVQSSGHALFKKKKDLIEQQRVGQNINETIEMLQEFQNVLEITSVVDELIQQNKYYSALRRLDELENEHLKPLMQYELAQMIRDSIPDMRERVCMDVTKQLKSWMYDVREKSGAVGRVALETMETRQQRWRHRSQKDPMLRMSSINSPIEQIVNERMEVNFLQNDKVHVDFKPLYQCIHIHEVLNQREKLQANYHEDRKAQANLLLSRHLNMHQSNRELMALLEEVIGYFVIECHVSYTSPPSFRPMGEVEDVWENVCERLVDMVNVGLRDCKDTKVFIETKAALQTFVRTMESLEFSVTRMNGVILSLFRRFAELLRERFANDFHQAVREAQHQPMIVNNPNELAKVLSVCWLKPGEAEELQKQSFPLSLPFSQTYPLCCMDIRSLVEQYYNFSGGTSQRIRDIDAILTQSIDELLVQQISVNIRETVEQSNNLSQIAQIIVNIEHFQLACKELEAWLTDSRTSHPSSRLVLGASHHLATTLEIAQKRIDTALFVKLDQFLDLLEYDWTPSQLRSGSQHQASPYLRDLIDWLSTMMDSALILLPSAAKSATFQSCFMHITNRILNSSLLDREVNRVNMAGLTHLERDVTFLYNYALSLHVDGMEGVFGQIRQTLAVILSESVSEYALSSLARSQKFPQAQPVKVSQILDKLAAFYASQPGQTELAQKCQRERDMVRRLIQR
ncbi:Rab GTPase-binding exocyst subunit S15 [Malassezia nana]|uniref:Exocyst complex component SEC15 n=1 Tax=Malassezia nana TaxID=180528 RepID=A0AAF0EN34_9BASI|nr:Rab GTPase-binding exocyst subunit S15 [Malassezia nana]